MQVANRNQLIKTQTQKLNLGCGNQVLPDWTNVDYALGAKLYKFPLFPWLNRQLKLFNLEWHPDIFLWDLRQHFPWEDNSIDVVYSSHTLEHFNKQQGLNFLRECYRVLQPGGIIRIVVPDLSPIVQRYCNQEVTADDFVDLLEVSYDNSHENFIHKLIAPLIKFPHKCMYDTKTLLRIMSAVGFACQSKPPFDSEIFDIDQIELLERTVDSVIVEGIKIS